MKNWRKENGIRLMCWTIFLALFFSCVFSEAGSSCGRRLGRNRSGMTLSAGVVVGSEQACLFDCVEPEVFEASKHELCLDKALCLVRRIAPMIALRVSVRSVRSGRISVTDSTVNCPLLI